jgi:hypothetical protein
MRLVAYYPTIRLLELRIVVKCGLIPGCESNAARSNMPCAAERVCSVLPTLI